MSRPPGTPLMNIPDQVWNHGEGFSVTGVDADHGGFLDADHLAGLGSADVFSYEAPDHTPYPPGWHPYTYVNHLGQQVNVARFVGYLRPNGLGPYATLSGAPVEDAAFEVFAPTAYDSSKPLVVVIGTWSTWPTPLDEPVGTFPNQVQNQRADRFKYPGHRRLDGLVLAAGFHDDIARPGPDIVNLVANPPPDVQVISAYIVPRTFPRPMVFEMQRYRQLAKAVDLMLAEPLSSPKHPPTFPQRTEPATKMLAGASFGGLTAQAGALHFPMEFHGAASAAFSGSVRRTMGEQFLWDLIGRRCGTGLYETSLNLQDTLEWGMWYRQQGLDYFNGSAMLRRRLGDQHRPLMLLVADEDTVTCGVDWLPLLSGVRGHDPVGMLPANAPGSNGSAEVYWSVVDRRCHGEGGVITTPVGGNVTSWLPDAEREFTAVVAAHVQATPGQSFPSPGFVADDGSEDPYDALLARGLRPVAPPNPFLQLGETFGEGGRTAGHGLTLGWDESLKSLEIGGNTWLYAGDADGVVHRFRLEPATQSIEEVARSRSLGFGAWALATGELQGGAAPVVVVGTLRHLYVLDALDLTTVLATRELDFEWERPRRMAIAEVHGGNATKEIVVATFQGHLLVFDAQLQLMTDLGEPGIQDFVVQEGVELATETSSKVPVTLLSHRGHLVNVTLEDQGVNPGSFPARLHAWSPGERGAPGDLELVEIGGVSRVVASYGVDTRLDPPLWNFPATTLDQAGAIPFGLGAQPAGVVASIEALHDGNDVLLGFVQLTGDYLQWIPVSGGVGELKALGTFAPAHQAIAMLAVDLDGAERVGGQPNEEIVIATRSGHLVWMRLAEVRAASVALPLPRPTSQPWYASFARTNKTLAGTWGMVSREYYLDQDVPLYMLYAANQAGELFEIDPQTGAGAWLGDLRYLSEVWDAATSTKQFFNLLPITPIRDLVYVGDQLSGVASGATELIQRALQGEPGWWLNTFPWLNRFQAYLNPEWYKDPPILNGKYAAEPSPKLPILAGFAPLTGAGAIDGFEEAGPGVRELYWWGGAPALFPNLVQGAYMDPNEVFANWYTTEDTQGVPNYGRATVACKDLRNNIPDTLGSTYNLQSLRLAEDDSGRLIVGSTAGGSIVVIRPYSPHGLIAWSSEDAVGQTPGPHDDGYGAMALAVRQVPGTSPPAVDIFYATTFGHTHPTQLPPTGGHAASALRWLRWDGAQMSQMGSVVHLDPSAASSGRGGFTVSGLAVGDIVQEPGHPGDELVATTLDGDLFVFDISSGAIAVGTPLVHTWVDAALGAYNAILIEDIDSEPGAEMYVGSSQGIYKWTQK